MSRPFSNGSLMLAMVLSNGSGMLTSEIVVDIAGVDDVVEL